MSRSNRTSMFEHAIQRSTTYVLGHSEGELQRLMLQSRVFGDLTAHFLLESGTRARNESAGFGVWTW